MNRLPDYHELTRFADMARAEEERLEVWQRELTGSARAQQSQLIGQWRRLEQFLVWCAGRAPRLHTLTTPEKRESRW